MDDWESFFKEKSLRRSLAQRRYRAIKAAVVILLAGSSVIGAYLLIEGLPR